MTRIGSLFTGYGGLDLAARDVFADSDMVWHCDNDTDVAAILDHCWPEVPNLGDITTVDWSGVEPVDVLTGGFPCQDISHAGRGAGMRPGTRSGLWLHMAHAIRELRPKWVVAENVRGLRSAGAHSDVEPCPWCLGEGTSRHLRALGAVLGDLAVLGYDAGWCSVRASDVGAPHQRFRIFLLASDTRRRSRDPRQPTPAGVAPQQREDSARDLPGGRGAAVAADPEPVPHEQLRIPGTVDEPTSGGGGANGHSARARVVGGGGVRGGGTTVAPDRERPGAVVWGPYEPAIRRWEQLTRPAPAPMEPSRNNRPRLSAEFVEWMMGLPPGHVTGASISRKAQLRALGNGVVPQQGAAALLRLFDAGVGER